MNKNKYDIKTRVSKGPLIFTLSALVVSIVIIVLLAIFAHKKVLGIVAIIFMSIIFLASIGVLIGVLFDYSYIKDNELVMVYIFKKTKIKIEKIKVMELKNGVYTVYDIDDKKIGTINSMNIDADKLLLSLESKGHMVIK